MITSQEKRKIIERIYARDHGVSVEWAAAFLRHNREIYRQYRTWVFPEPMHLQNKPKNMTKNRTKRGNHAS